MGIPQVGGNHTTEQGQSAASMGAKSMQSLGVGAMLTTVDGRGLAKSAMHIYANLGRARTSVTTPPTDASALLEVQRVGMIACLVAPQRESGLTTMPILTRG